MLSQYLRNTFHISGFQEVVLSQLVTIANGMKTLLKVSEEKTAYSLEEINFALPVTNLQQFAELKIWIETGLNYNQTVL